MKRDVDDKILSVNEVCRMLGISRATFNRMRADGQFISAIQVSKGRVGWWKSEVLEELEERRRPE